MELNSLTHHSYSNEGGDMAKNNKYRGEDMELTNDVTDWKTLPINLNSCFNTFAACSNSGYRCYAALGAGGNCGYHRAFHSSYHNDVFLAPREVIFPHCYAFNFHIKNNEKRTTEPLLSSNDEDENMDDVEYQTDSEVEDPDNETNPRQWRRFIVRAVTRVTSWQRRLLSGASSNHSYHIPKTVKSDNVCDL
ncbi:hypothetical protein J6590_036684 [Homalodisca vitripennis]|nr:hypothetical protein J6590_036684 [Homalodisca vitripennis]